MIFASPPILRSTTCSASYSSPPRTAGSSPPLSPPSPLLDSVALVHAIGTCAARRDIFLVAPLHAAAIKSGIFTSNLFVANACLDAYAKCSQMDTAAKLFGQMPHRDIVSWTSLISGYCLNGSASIAISVFCDLISDELAPDPNEFTLASISQACALLEGERMGQAVHGYCLKRSFSEGFVCNSLIAMYARLGFMVSADKLFIGLKGRNVVSWSAIISGHVLQSRFSDAINKFTAMLEDGFLPNFVTMLSIIQACSLMNERRFFSWVHAWISKLGLGSIVFVANSLVEMYCKNGLLDDGIRVFIQLWSSRGKDYLDPAAMAAIVRCCTLSKTLQFGRAFHGFLVKHRAFPCFFIENSMIDMYGTLNQVDSANQIFRGMKDKDLVSWNSMITCFLKNSFFSKALNLLTELHCSNEEEDDLTPDAITMLSSIQACAELPSLKHGEILHGYSVKTGFDSDMFVSNALLCMYAKSGRLDCSEKLFHGMDLKDLSTWNAMILAYGIHGDGKTALSLFHELMKTLLHKPNEVTFANLITACSHSGLVTEGYECFKSMQRDYDIEPDMEHYSSVVDLFARSGKLCEAEEFIRGMPIKPGSAIWTSLLGACGIYGDVEIAERAAEVLSVLEPDGNGWRVSLSNAYGAGGRWKEAARVRAEMKKVGVRKKVAGWSSVEVNGVKSSRFMVGDTKHPESRKIYDAWRSLNEQLMDVFE